MLVCHFSVNYLVYFYTYVKCISVTYNLGIQMFVVTIKWFPKANFC